MLENLLEWAKMQRNLVSMAPVSFSVRPNIIETMKVLKPSALTKDIAIEEVIPENTMAFADERMFESVVHNLLTNALKFTKRGGKVTVSVKKTDDEFNVIKISDTGIGMPKEIADGLFQIGKNCRRAGTEGEPSSGLGLVICKDFVEKQGGKIWVESTEGQGTDFFFTIPEK
jgi:signal transduction histidine kinase